MSTTTQVARLTTVTTSRLVLTFWDAGGAAAVGIDTMFWGLGWPVIPDPTKYCGLYGTRHLL
jgi:hypothetical protein